MHRTLINLAELHYELGLIGHDELIERVRIARWISEETSDSNADPRGTPSTPSQERSEVPELEAEYHEEVPAVAIIRRLRTSPDDNWMELVCLGTWVFTKADPDAYPSVPHGHYRNQNKKWPKLNPYTGRVFSDKHQEDSTKRLTKKEMQLIWSDENFKSFCREMIVWYRESFPYYEFPVRRPLRFPRW